MLATCTRVISADWITADGHQKLRNGGWHKLDEETSEAICHYMAFCAFSLSPPPPNFVRKADPNMVEAAIAALPINEFIAAQMDLNGRGDISDIIGNMSRVDSFTPDPKFITKVDFGESVPIGDHAEVIITGGGICLVRRRPRTGQLTAIWPDFAYDFRVQNGHLNPVWFDME